MKIAILGTRGIPNNYGGFEQFAEYLSVELVSRGHEVTVYNSDQHLFKESVYKGVNIIHKKDPENKLGTAGQFIYDFFCIIDSRKHDFDIVLNLGYTSSSVWSRFFSKKAIVITNMDGLEWKRTKFNKYVQKFLLYAERLAVKHSHHLISDSKGIQTYLSQKYGVSSEYIAYGANVFENPNEELISRFNIEKYNYNIILARIEPENNIETILEGLSQSANQTPTLVIGNSTNKFGLHLQKKFKSHSNIRFIGPEYNIEMLNNLRYYSKFYFHGHSVGGTNPSLLEAMASQSFIIAHDNEFNKSILEKNARYFKTSDDIKNIIDTEDMMDRQQMIDENFRKIKSEFSWNYIIDCYEKFMLKVFQNI